MSEAKADILGRLAARPSRPAPDLPHWTPPAYGTERLARFRSMLVAARAEVAETTTRDWPADVIRILNTKGARNLLHGLDGALGERLAAACRGPTPRLMRYDRPVEAIRDELVHHTDAGLTTAMAGIAQTGSVVLWPDADQPRLISLLPPLHVVLVQQRTIVDSLAALMTGAGWSHGMPTNAVLISGPSKTADIEQTLAYGVHGPKELVVLVVDGDL